MAHQHGRQQHHQNNRSRKTKISRAAKKEISGIRRTRTLRVKKRNGQKIREEEECCAAAPATARTRNTCAHARAAGAPLNFAHWPHIIAHAQRALNIARAEKRGSIITQRKRIDRAQHAHCVDIENMLPYRRA